MHIGKRIKEVLFQQNHSAVWLSEQIPCERSNVYDIFNRTDISVGLLLAISRILQFDFFKEISEQVFTPPYFAGENEGRWRWLMPDGQVTKVTLI